MERIISMDNTFRQPRPAPDTHRPNLFFPFPPISEDNAMAARFFIVTLDENGNTLHTHTKRISAVSKEEAEKMAVKIHKKINPAEQLTILSIWLNILMTTKPL